jgi:hypothetical protein
MEFLKKIINNPPSKKQGSSKSDPREPGSVEEEWKTAVRKKEEYFPTLTKAVGWKETIGETTIQKLSKYLYLWEGKNFQIRIHTENYTLKNGDAIQGLVHMDEISMNEWLFKDPQLFLDSLGQQVRADAWKKILTWERIWCEQLFMKLRPDCIALLLLTMNREFFDLFMKSTSQRQKDLIRKELFYLNISGDPRNEKEFKAAGSLSWKNIPLAVEEFYAELDAMEKKRES